MSLNTLKIFRFCFFIAIILSAVALCNDGLSPLIGGLLAVEIYFFLKINREIRRIKDLLQIVKILNKLLGKLKETNNQPLS